MDNTNTEVKEPVEKKKKSPKRVKAKRPVAKKKPVKRSAKSAKRAKAMRNASTYILGTVLKVIMYIAVACFVYFACSKAYDFGTKLFVENGVAEEGSEQDIEVVVTIPAGASTSEVASILKQNGLIEDELIFMVQAMLYEGEFKSGTYTLRTSYEPEVIVDTLSAR